MSKAQFNRVAVFGVGLMGTSFALALKQRQLAKTILGWDKSKSHLKTAEKLGAIDQGWNRLVPDLWDVDLIVLALPVQYTIEFLKRIPEGLVLDLGSTKASFAKAAKLRSPKLQVVPCHPMAGKAESGPKAAEGDLFVNRTCFIVNADFVQKTSLKKISDLWKSLGSKVHFVSAKEHDSIVAKVSHVPQLIASALVGGVAGEKNAKALVNKFASSGWKDTTRIASSDVQMWEEIVFDNDREVLKHLKKVRQQIESVEGWIQKGNRSRFRNWFQKVSAFRKSVK